MKTAVAANAKLAQQYTSDEFWHNVNYNKTERKSTTNRRATRMCLWRACRIAEPSVTGVQPSWHTRAFATKACTFAASLRPGAASTPLATSTPQG